MCTSPTRLLDLRRDEEVRPPMGGTPSVLLGEIPQRGGGTILGMGFHGEMKESGTTTSRSELPTPVAILAQAFNFVSSRMENTKTDSYQLSFYVCMLAER